MNFPLRILVLALLLLASRAGAHIVTVATYPELYAACTQAVPHDTIVMKNGTYTINDGKSRIYISNRPGPVVVMGETQDPSKVIVEGLGQDDPTVEMIFDLDNCPSWEFDNFTTRNSYYHGFKFDHSSTDCTLLNVIMRDHGSAAIKGTSDPASHSYPDRLSVINCDIGYTTKKGGTRDVVEGLDAVGVSNWVIVGNRFINVQKTGGDGIAYGCFTKGNSLNTQIIGNRFEDCFIGASLGGGGTDPQFFRDSDQTYEHQHGLIVNNVIIRCNDAGIYINKGADTKVYNNTLYGCELSIQFRFEQTTGEIINNLVRPADDNMGEPVFRLRNGATASKTTHNLSATDDDFIGPSGTSDQLDLHLRAGSKAIDSAEGIYFVDHDYVIRPKGNGFDIGAYEYIPADGVEAALPAAASRVRYLSSSHRLLIEWPASATSNCTIQLADLLGRIVMVKSGTAAMLGDVALSHELRGAYFICLNDGSTQRIEKIVIY